MTTSLIYHFFDDDDFLLISKKIKETEKITAGEVRFAIKEDKPLFGKSVSVRDLAVREFHKLGMEKTRDRTGILLFIDLASRQFYILADEGINSKVKRETWDLIRDQMQKEFKLGHYLEGILSAIENVGEILASHFPVKANDVNELSNKVVT